jgi:LuxR family maltose regulon positive regulatory protein
MNEAEAMHWVEAISSREKQVLDLLTAGHTNQSIADTLGITLTTVKSHAGAIYTKLGVKSRTQAIARARELGLLS